MYMMTLDFTLKRQWLNEHKNSINLGIRQQAYLVPVIALTKTN